MQLPLRPPLDEGMEKTTARSSSRLRLLPRDDDAGGVFMHVATVTCMQRLRARTESDSCGRGATLHPARKLFLES